MTYRSKIDLWLVAVLALASLAPILVAGHAVVSIAIAAFSLWLLSSTGYTVRDGEVLVRSGPFRWRIAARSITRVVPSRSAASGPALSLDRLRIEYDGGRRGLLVSPKDRAGFVAAVESARTQA